MIVLLQSDYQLPRMGLVILGAGSNRSAHCATPTTLLTMFMVWPQRVKAHSDLTQGYADSTVGLRQYRERKFPNFHVLHSVWMCHKSWCVAIKRCLDFDCFCFRKMEIVFFKKTGQLRPLFVYFWSFQTNNTIFATNQCEKCPSSIRRWDSNSRPLKHESSPITARPP